MNTNPFIEKDVAEQWIEISDALEAQGEDARENEIYPYLHQWVKHIKPEVVVEIGSGQGVCSDKLGEFRGSYIGVEPSHYLIERARELYGKHKNRKFVAGDAYALPLEDNVADAVFSVCVWFHLGDLEKAAQEMARILKSDGEFVIVTGHPNSWHLWKSFFEKDLKQEGNELFGTMELTGGPLFNHLYMHTDEDLSDSLAHAGLTISEKIGMGYGEEHNDQGIFIAIKGHK